MTQSLELCCSWQFPSTLISSPSFPAVPTTWPESVTPWRSRRKKLKLELRKDEMSSNHKQTRKRLCWCPPSLMSGRKSPANLSHHTTIVSSWSFTSCQWHRATSGGITHSKIILTHISVQVNQTTNKKLALAVLDATVGHKNRFQNETVSWYLTPNPPWKWY